MTDDERSVLTEKMLQNQRDYLDELSKKPREEQRRILLEQEKTLWKPGMGIRPCPSSILPVSKISPIG